MNKPHKLDLLPPSIDIENTTILKKLAKAHRFLAELKGISATIPNQAILINTLALQEAKDSSAIENIVTTHDELFQQELFAEATTNAAAKEVSRYSGALKKGYQQVIKTGLLTTNHIKEIHTELGGGKPGLRTLPGTALKNKDTGATVYVPPQEGEEILRLMGNLEKYINDESFSEVDPLIKMAVVHYQFESIHPFYDGNGRTGRIINILYLVQKGLLNIPVLYLSRYIIERKNDYYRLLQAVRDGNAWAEWVLFMLDGVERTSRQTIRIVQSIGEAMLDYKHRIREKMKFYSQDLLNNLFSHPYTKIQFLQKGLSVSRLTATKYLDLLAQEGFLVKHKLGRSNFYVNTKLFDILTKVPDAD
jgi:Fic family protein